MKKNLAMILIILMMFSSIVPVHAAQYRNVDKNEKPGYMESPVRIEYQPDLYGTWKGPSKFIPKDAREDLADYTAPTTPVKDQQSLGTCWAHAAYGNMESFLKQKKGVEYDFSENHAKNLLAKGMIKGKNPYSYDWDVYQGGNFDMMTAYWTRGEATGPVLEADDPYDGSERKVELQDVLAKPITGQYVSGTKTLGSIYFENGAKNWWKSRLQKSYIKDMKAMIQKYGAIYATYYSSDYTDQIFSYQDGTQGLAYLSRKRKQSVDVNLIDHAITVVGWDDTFSRKNFSKECRPDADGAFLVKNSWGDQWGEKGYFWISYEEYFSQASTITNLTTRDDLYDHLYEYDTFGLTTNWWCGSSEKAVYMNCFKRESLEQQKVTAVSTYFLQPGVTANFYISPTRDAKDLKKVATKKVNKIGFQVIDLKDAAVTITDSRYLAAVEIVAPKEDFIEYPVEYPIDDYDSQADAALGQSYAAESGIEKVKKGKYVDLVKNTGAKLNVCIKAYTKDTGVKLTNLSKAEVNGYTDQTYTGKLIKQTPVVRLDGETLVEGRDYRIVYKNATNPGIATMTIVGNGIYSGSVSKDYKIFPKPTKITAVSSTSKGKLKLKWESAAKVSGYEVYGKKSGSSKYTRMRTTSSTSTTLQGLKSKQKYYVKVRAYKNVKGQKVYSSFSKWRSKTIK
jgi:C1A family cysteine protease